MKIILSHRLKIIEPPDQMARKIHTTFIIENPGGLTTTECLDGMAELIPLGG